MLKASHIIPPALALVAVAIWNVYQWNATKADEQHRESLRGAVTDAKPARSSASASAAASASRVSKPKVPAAGEPIDWKSLATKLKNQEEDDGAGDVRTMLAYQQRVEDMSREEILAAFADISKLGLDAEQQTALEEMLIGPLIEKDPQAALEKFADRIPLEDDAIGAELSTALGAWAKKDPAAAAAWLDKQIAAGLFESKSLDGVNQARLEFEAQMVGVLLGTDIAAAEQRIAALPEDQRREALEQIPFSELSPSAQTAYAGLVRGLVPQDERQGSFTHVISDIVPDGGLEKASEFLDSIHATPEERDVSAREAANAHFEEIATERAITRDDVEAMRAWVKQQAPSKVDRVTGEALADAAQDGGEFSFDEASDLALEYHKLSGNDDLLVAFLESFAARSNLEEAISLADHIKDAKLREDVLKRLK